MKTASKKKLISEGVITSRPSIQGNQLLYC